MEYRNKKLEKIFSKISSIFVSLLFAVLLTVGIGYLLNYKLILIVGESARPTIHYHDAVLVAEAKVENLEIGDYVTRRVGNSFVTHKVVRIWQDDDGVFRFDTQGYQNNVTDGPENGFVQKDLLGKVIAHSTLVGNLVAYYQGYTQIGVFNASSANRTLGIFRIVETIIMLVTVSKYSKCYKFEEEFSKNLYY